MTGRQPGTVTFLFTDIEGSTARWDERPDAMVEAVALHDGLLHRAIEEHGGSVLSTAGDGVAAAFARADAAVAAAVAAQGALTAASWPGGLAVRARMGIHTGEAHERDGAYFGPAVNRAACVMDAANGTQILVSAATRQAVGPEHDEALRFVDHGLHDLPGVAEPVRLYAVESSVFDHDPRPPRTGTNRSGSLPRPRTAVLGRDGDVEAVVADLADRRLVTLTGVGGIGKTRLAVEVGRRLQPALPDGVWFAPLDTVERPEGVRAALMGLLGIEGGDDDLASLVEGLRHREALLVLDSCEHVLEAVAETVVAVVESCPLVRVLATSREPLDVAGERVRRVRPLATDDGGPAVALFLERAEEAGAPIDPGADADAIARACRRLDGIPLAIELAAARTRSIRPAELADRLDDMLRLLTAGRRGAAERHRTLRATLEWSYDMLDEAEQAVLGRLSVFAGSFSLDAADAVAGDGALDVLDVLDRLVARSLVVPVDDGDESRFRLLEPVRHLAAEKLARRGETDRARGLHTEWYLDLLVGLDQRWRSGDDQHAWPVAWREMPNLRVAFDDLVAAGRVADAQRFAAAAYCPVACHFDSAPMYEWAPRAAAMDLAYVGPWTATVCAAAAWGAVSQGDHAGAGHWVRRGVEALGAGAHDDGLVAAAAGHLVLAGGDPAVSEEFVARSVEAALASGDLHRQVWVLTYAGRVEEARDAAARLGNKLLDALALIGVSMLAPDGRDAAREAFWEAATASHSYLMRNHAATELAYSHIRGGTPVEGLLLLRAPARDWLHRNDGRVWSVLHVMAIGMAAAGEAHAAARLTGAIADRPLPFISERRRGLLARLLDERLDPGTARKLQAAGRAMDAGTALAVALAQIDELAARPSVTVADPDDGALTPRQLEIAELVARGLTNKQIAQRLGISRFTAETHVRNILERLGAATRAEIASWVARRLGATATRSGTASRT